MARPNLIRRIVAKSPRTVAYRGVQELRLKLMQVRGGWRALSSKIHRRAIADRCAGWLEDGNFSVLADDGAIALQQAVKSGCASSSKIFSAGDDAIARRISIFGSPITPSEPWPWHQDWRFGHTWQPTYFRNYDHHSPRLNTFDVKFPWELSRMAYLISMVQADVVDGGSLRTTEAFSILSDWTDENPLAHSVNWYPMEAAVRGINLCVFSDMSRQKGIDQLQACQLFQTLAEHGEFIERTLEFTDNAGNHFAAELVALLLLGHTLTGYYVRAEAWKNLAANRLEYEIVHQFLPDGVNFEKSTAYHRLVLELYLLAATVLRRTGRTLSDEAEGRLRHASYYMAWFQRPDNRCPLIGDTDDASVFSFDHNDTRDHRPALGVAALYFEDAQLQNAAGPMPNAASWLFGSKALPKWKELDNDDDSFSGHRYFRDGGVFIAKTRQHYLFVDVGEVGQNGLGGHGHNDILSFELFLGGHSVVVDPGTYLYSGDLELHSRLRSTQSHNGLQVDGEEIAPLIGNFRIGNRAKPIAVCSSNFADEIVSIEAGHTGYQCLTDPVLHHRQIVFDLASGALRCNDEISSTGQHTTSRFLHFSPKLDPVLEGNEVHIKSPTDTIVVRWSESCDAFLRDDHVCPGFGRIEPAKTLVINKDTSGNSVLGLDLFRRQSGPIDRETTKS